jgi:hypothetical protein
LAGSGDGVLFSESPGNSFDREALMRQRKSRAPAIRAEPQILVGASEIEEAEFRAHAIAPIALVADWPNSSWRVHLLTIGVVFEGGILIFSASA